MGSNGVVASADRMLHFLLYLLILLLAPHGVQCDQGGTCGELGRSSVHSQPNSRVLVMVKPDAVQRGLVGQLVARFEQKGFQLVAMKMVMAEQEVLEEHYAEHKDRSFFPSLIQFMQSGPVVPMVWAGNNIVPIARAMLGATDPLNSLIGTIRGDFAASKEKNLCHVSDSPESAEREINLWFKQSELLNWQPSLAAWVN